MEQIGWDGRVRPAVRAPPGQWRDWPEALEPLTDTYVDQVFQGPLGWIPVIRQSTSPSRAEIGLGRGFQKKMLTFLADSTFWSRISLRLAIFQAPSTRRSTSCRAPT